MGASGSNNGRFRLFGYWPLIFLPVVAVADILVFIFDIRAGFVVLAFAAALAVFAIVWSIFWTRRANPNLFYNSDLSKDIGEIFADNLPAPGALLASNGDFVWINSALSKIMPGFLRRYKNIMDLFPDMKETWASTDKKESVHVRLNETYYRLTMCPLSDPEAHIVVIMDDETGFRQLASRFDEHKIAVGLVYVDNFEEVMNSTEGVRQALLAALIERKIQKYFRFYGGLVNRLEKDKFFVLFYKKDLVRMEQDHFSILEDAKTLNIGNDVLTTLSIGIGCESLQLANNAEYARKAIDLALGRGGDQAVVRSADGRKFFGGKSQYVGKSTRVKARIKAQALRELFSTKDQVLIMGHANPDADSLGAAAGIFRAAQSIGKKAAIVMGDATQNIACLLERFSEDPEYENMLISHSKAIDRIDDNTTLVVVDTNRPDITECPELLKLAKSIVVFDHHRQGDSVIDHAILSYVEPYASSTSELVAEILQYFTEDLKLKLPEAEALYAGIVIDTDNFTNKTGVRTFEAAAYLRGCGADAVKIRKMFRESMEDYRAKARTLTNAELFQGSFALGICTPPQKDNALVIGAQAANELLNIVGVKASIVFTELDGTIYISARSIDEVNVQLIMERLGGGGHLSTAAAQMTGCTAGEAKELVKETILQMIVEGAI